MKRLVMAAALLALLLATALLTTAVGSATSGADVEVRVVARGVFRNGEQQVEFAIEQKMPDGSWSERKFGQYRYMTPALIADGGWKAASPVTVSTSPATGTPVATPTATATPTYGTQQMSGGWRISSETDPITGQVKTYAINSKTTYKSWEYSTYDYPAIVLRCTGSTFEAYASFDTYIGSLNDRIPVVYRIGSTTRSETWGESTSGTSAFAANDKRFARDLVSGDSTGESLNIRATGYDGDEFTVTFDIAGLRNVLGNLGCYR